jgi:hypothetical protein
LDVGDDDIRRVSLGLSNEIIRVARRRHDVESRLSEHVNDSLAEEGLILPHHHADR